MIIGGEYFFSPGFLFQKTKNTIDNLVKDFQLEYHINFTFGGYHSLLAIIDAIKSKFDHDSVVLLPSYLCPSILKSFKIRDIKYRFYKVDADLFVDTDHLISIIDSKVKAVFFIDYFGASQMERLKPVIDSLRSKKIIIIQDVVQCLELRKEFLFGDFIFNSFRKYFPFEGSILLSKEKMSIDFGKTRIRYLMYKRIGQLMRYFHVKYNIFPSRFFLSLFRRAEDRYCTNDIARMPKFNRRQLNKYDIQFIADKQKYNFSQLFSTFSDKVPKLLIENNFVPLSFVIKINRRDEIRRYLSEQNIFTPIHWELPVEIDKCEFMESWSLSVRILSIPINEKIEQAELEFIINIIKNTL